MYTLLKAYSHAVWRQLPGAQELLGLRELLFEGLEVQLLHRLLQARHHDLGVVPGDPLPRSERHRCTCYGLSLLDRYQI